MLFDKKHDFYFNKNKCFGYKNMKWVELCHNKKVEVISPYAGLIGEFTIVPSWCESNKISRWKK